MKNILVYGSKDFGIIIKNLVIECGHNFTGYIDDFYKGDEVLGTFQEVSSLYPKEKYEIVIAIGYKDLKKRWEIYQNVVNKGYRVAKLIHPEAYVHKDTTVSDGTIIMAGVIVDLNVCLNEITVLWPGVIINHDSYIGKNTFLSPGSIVCGFCHIASHCFIGAGAVIVNNNKVLKNTFIKAGKVYHETKHIE